LPRETPAGENPPTGAIIYYNLKSVPSAAVMLEVLDSKGSLIRKYSSDEQPNEVDDRQPFPTYWLPAPKILPKRSGMNRFVWDLRYDRPRALHYGYGIAAVPSDATLLPEGPLVLPGSYLLKLTVAAQTFSTMLEVKMDPRVGVGISVLRQQLDLEMKIADTMARSYEAFQQIRDLRRQLKDLQTKTENDPKNKDVAEKAKSLDAQVLELGGSGQSQYPPPTEPTLAALNDALSALAVNVDSADAVPTVQAKEAFETYQTLVSRRLENWSSLKSTELKAFNALLRERGLPTISVSSR
jgi:hypothetical protein